MDHYTIPNIFLQRYIFLLSSDAFCTLIRFYKFYIDNEEKYKDKKDEFEIPFSIFKSQILVSDDNDLTESIWGELTYWELARRYYKNNVYVLNLTKIHSDNGIDEKGEFSIKIFDKKGKIRRKKNIKIYVDKYIEEGILSRCAKPRIAEKLRKTIEGTVEYFNSKKKNIELEDIRKLAEPLLESEERILEKVCDIYNNDEKYYGKRHPNYILGILKNIKDERKFQSTQKSDDFKTKNLDKYTNVKNESNRNLALKIARGQIKNNIAYNSYLELGDIKGLKKLYNIGVSILKEENQESEIYDEYDWLKND